MHIDSKGEKIMKKFFALLLVLTMALTLFACGKKDDPAKKSEGVMTYAEYMAADIGSEVVIEAYVQATQSWWNDSITIYAQDTEGGYFLYNMACSEADAAKLVPGAKIRAKGSKAEWAGEIEIMEGTLEILEGSYKPAATDVTALLGSDDLAKHMNKKVSFKGMTVEAANDAGDAFLYNWDGSGSADSDSDLYFNVSVNGNTYSFCVEYYLCGPDSDAYKAVQNLKVGDKIDLEGFLYWYEGPQPHITAVAAAE